MIPARERLLLAALVALTLAPVTRSQAVHIVAGDGSGDYTQLQAAVNAAANEDIILVRPYVTPYDPTVIDGRSLAIVGESASRPKLDELAIRHLAAGQAVTLRALDIEGSATSDGFGSFILHDGLILLDNTGCVWLEDVLLAGDTGFSNWGDLGFGRTGLVAGGNDCVVIVESQVRGGNGGLSTGASPYPGGLAARLVDTQLAVYGSTIAGGDGHAGLYYPQQWGARGGNALDGTLSAVFASGSLIDGGETGAGHQPSPDPTASGLVIDGSAVRVVDATIQPGGGDALQTGAPIVALGAPSVVVDLVDVHRSLRAPATVREGNVGQMTYAGQPGDVVLLQASFSADFVPYYAGLKGVAHFGGVVAGVVLGVAGPSGAFFKNFVCQQLPVGVEGWRVFAQPVILASGGALRLGGPSTCVLLDATIPLP